MPIADAGALDRRITIQRKQETGQNGFNEEDEEDWSALATVWAKRRDASDSQKIEYLAAGQVGAFQVARFTVRSTSVTRTITPVDRLTEKDLVWEIQGIKELDEGRNRFLEITASRGANHG